MNEKINDNKEIFDLESKIIKISEELNRSKIEANNNWELFIRAKAEIENVKKRFEKEIINLTKYSSKKIFIDLLPILDSLESCLENENNKNHRIYIGIKLLYKMIILFLDRNNIKKMKINKYTKFDPTKHEVISTVNNNIHENKILSIFQSGYILHDQVIRYAKVSISKKN